MNSLSPVQKLHVQQPGERAVLHHRLFIGLHLLREHFKGDVLLTSTVLAPESAVKVLFSQ